MKSLCAVLLGWSIGMSCFAAPPSPPGGSGGEPPSPPDFSELDSDGDGYVSRSEASKVPPLKDHFDGIDSNSDGLLSEQELESHRPGPPPGSSD